MTYDVLIVGGGLTGLSLGCALRHLPHLRVGIIDATTYTPSDKRSIALSHGSRKLFEKHNLWAPITASASPIKQVHVSDQGHFGITRFTAEEARVPALGYVVPLQALQNTLVHALDNTSIEWIRPASVHSMSPTEQGWELTIQNGQKYTAKLVVAADGSNSTIRQLQHIPVIEQYAGQTAIVANITLSRVHANIAYERFTPTGAIALLPIAEKTYALIWTVPTEKAESYLAFDTHCFLSKLQHEFGYRLGRFMDASPRHAHVLKQSYAEEQIKPGLVLLGNSAHTLHPIAAQGFNLGLRDIDCLAKLISENKTDNLQPYLAARLPDQKRLMQFTNGLVRLFSKTSPLIRIPCNLGLLALDFPSVFKQAACRYGMGVP
jgi:2-octaprenyl-6-methoxyphenol hydroxylase